MHVAHAVLLGSVFDLRGLPKFACNTQHPAKLACHICKVKGVWVKELHTTIFEGAFTHLCESHHLRKAAFDIKLPDNDILVDSLPPARKTHDEVIESGAATELRKKAKYENGQLSIPFVTRHLSYYDL
jgi:hypothetical protein